MKMFLIRTVSLAAGALALAGCATRGVQTPADVPLALRAPAGQSAYAVALAAGVQIYECATKPNDPTAWAWVFRGPEAALTDLAGRSVGKHYAGPSWESLDGSVVVGQVKASDPGPNASAIPWLLLTAKSTAGQGLFAQTASIQRVQTVGGVAPAEACDAANAKQVARVPYTATYYFYRVG